MSMEALLQSCRDHIQVLFGLDADSCEVMMDGHPKPSAGELFIAVHPGRWGKAAKGDVGQGESLGVKVTVTRRLGEAPRDRWGTAVMIANLGNRGLYAICRKIMYELAGDNTGNLDTQSRYQVLIDANAYLGIPKATPPAMQQWNDGFQVPLEFRDGGIPETKGYEWFSSPPPEPDADGYIGQVECGVAQTLTFDGAERYYVFSLAT